MADRSNITINGRTYIPLTPVNSQRISGARTAAGDPQDVRPRVSEDTVPLTGPEKPRKSDGTSSADLAQRMIDELEIPKPVAQWLAENCGPSFARQLFEGCGAQMARAAASRRVAQAAQNYARALKANPHGLTERELAKCKAKGIDPAKYAATKRLMGGK